MKKTLVLFFILLLSISLVDCTGVQLEQEGELQNEILENQNNDETTVNRVVENFGKRLQFVSLLGSEDVLEESMQENYGEYVSQTLLEQWLKEPISAPGRLTSSPWPDRIEIFNTDKVSEKAYKVKGEIVEIATSEGSDIAATRTITLTVEKIGGTWLINNANLGEYEDTSLVIIRNDQYGFTFHLPGGWRDHKIISEEWKGLSHAGSNEGEVVETGPMISIRHPKWTLEEERQDIPIMIFTLKQWKSLEQEVFHIGAAPMEPRELDRNSKYVFALPARYNYAFPTGYEEVEEIMEENPLQANENINM